MLNFLASGHHEKWPMMIGILFTIGFMALLTFLFILNIYYMSKNKKHTTKTLLKQAMVPTLIVLIFSTIFYVTKIL